MKTFQEFEDVLAQHVDVRCRQPAIDLGRTIIHMSRLLGVSPTTLTRQLTKDCNLLERLSRGGVTLKKISDMRLVFEEADERLKERVE